MHHAVIQSLTLGDVVARSASVAHQQTVDWYTHRLGGQNRLAGQLDRDVAIRSFE